MIIIHHLSIMIVVCNDVILMSDINYDMCAIVVCNDVIIMSDINYDKCADRTSSALIDWIDVIANCGLV